MFALKEPITLRELRARGRQPGYTVGFARRTPGRRAHIGKSLPTSAHSRGTISATSDVSTRLWADPDLSTLRLPSIAHRIAAKDCVSAILREFSCRVHRALAPG